MDVDVTLVPQRETGMVPYEIMLSESQERMLLVVEQGREREVEEVFEKWDLHAVRDRHGHGDAIACGFSSAARSSPTCRRARSPTRGRSIAGRCASRSGSAACSSCRSTTLGAPAVRAGGVRRADRVARDREQALGLPPVRSHRRHQHHRAAGHVGGVARVKGTRRGLAVSVDCNGRFCYLDPYRGAMLAVAESARNVACAGGEPIGATNNLNFGNPERPEIMWQFAEAVRGIGDACRALDIPITGGNVSLYNETEGEAIYPTPVLGVVGLLEDASRTMTRQFKHARRTRRAAGR